MLHHLPLTRPPAPASGYRRIRKPLFAEVGSIIWHIIPSRRGRRSVPSLDQLPLEILQEIFTYACTDGGPTACALSLVSKEIHAASRATHFTSVSLVSGSMDMLSQFLEQFDGAQKAALAQGCQKPRIRHLCLIADPVPDYSVGLFDTSRRTSLDDRISEQMQKKEEANTNEEQWLAHVAELSAKYHSAVGELLSLVATDLETLCLYQLRDYRSPQEPYKLHVKCSNLPKLREFWINYDPTLLVFDHHTHRTRRLFVPFPELTRLHVHEPTHLDFSNWEMFAPKLESLRITVHAGTFTVSSPSSMNSLRRTMNMKRWPLRDPVHVLSFAPKSDEPFEAFYRWNAARFRKNICEDRSRAVFVPHYAFQDIAGDSRVKCDAHFSAKLAQEDWLARIADSGDAEKDGLYTRDYWRKSGQDDCSPHPPGKFMRRTEPVDPQVPPFIRWQLVEEDVRPAHALR